MIDFCFCNVSFGERYVRTQPRLKNSILQFYPDAKLFFWTNEMPPNARQHQDSCYGFKVHAIEYARQQGYKKVIWLDTCAVLCHPVEPLINLIKEHGFFVIQDDNKLYRYSGHWFKNAFYIDRNWHLLGGSIYIFDFYNPKATEIFEKWKLMEREGLFGNQYNINVGFDGEENCGHRMDETVLAYCMYTAGVEPFDPTTGRYNQDENSVILKKHFLEIGEKWYNK